MTKEEFYGLKPGNWIAYINYREEDSNEKIHWGEVKSHPIPDQIIIDWEYYPLKGLGHYLSGFSRVGLDAYLIARTEKEKLAIQLKYS